MSKYGLSMLDAKKLQEWALHVSGAEVFTKTLPKLPYAKKIKPGLYINYKIDKDELIDDGLDYCTPEIASVFVVDVKGDAIKLGSIRAYNWETYWLEIWDNCEVDTAKNWFELIKEEYEKLIKKGKND